MKAIQRIFTAALFLLAAGSTMWAQSPKPDALKAYNADNYARAIEICEAELLEDNTNMNSYTVMCWALIANRQYAEAEQKATQAHKINAFDVRIIEVLGEAKYFLDKNMEALNLFQRYIAKTNEHADRLGRVYYYMGEIYIKQAKYEHADIALSTAVRNQPKRDYWWTRLGYAREMVGDFSNALKAYDMALSLNPSQYDAKGGKERCQAKVR